MSEGPGSPELALALARRVVELSSRRLLWPGCNPLKIPLAVYDGHQTFLFWHPHGPQGFTAMDKGKPSGVVYGGRHPAVTANTCAEIGGVLVATVMLDRPSLVRNLDEPAALAIHEAFHVFQRTASVHLAAGQ